MLHRLYIDVVLLYSILLFQSISCHLAILLFPRPKQPAKLVPEDALAHVAGPVLNQSQLFNWRYALMHPEGLDDDELEQIRYAFLLTPVWRLDT